MISFIGWAGCPRSGLKVDQSNCQRFSGSVDMGLSADTAAPENAVWLVYADGLGRSIAVLLQSRLTIRLLGL